MSKIAFNSWYKVTKSKTDIMGYSLKEDWQIQPTSFGLYTQGLNILRFNKWDKNNFTRTQNFFAKTEAEVLGLIELVEDPTKILEGIEKQRREDIANHCDLSSGIYVGSDPEVFVTTKGGKLMPAFEFLKADVGTKPKPKSPYNYYDTPAIPTEPYWDGFQAEFKVQPAACHAYVVDYIQQGLKRLHTLAGEKSRGSKINCTPVMVIPQDLLMGSDEKYVELGCQPSLNAYDMMGEKPVTGRELVFRFAGFHIHHGLASYNRGTKDPKVIIPSMDNIVGVMSTSVLDGLENPIRRQYYGLAGEYRAPVYGLEYRVLSSAVLWHPAMTHLHFDFARAGMQFGMQNLANLWEGSKEETIAIINDLDVDQARKALKRNKKLMLGLIQRYYITAYTNYTSKVAPAEIKQRIFDCLLMGGVRQYIDLDVEANWKITSGTWKGHSDGDGCQMWRFVNEKFGEATVVAAK